PTPAPRKRRQEQEEKKYQTVVSTEEPNSTDCDSVDGEVDVTLLVTEVAPAESVPKTSVIAVEGNSAEIAEDDSTETVLDQDHSTASLPDAAIQGREEDVTQPGETEPQVQPVDEEETLPKEGDVPTEGEIHSEESLPTNEETAPSPSTPPRRSGRERRQPAWITSGEYALAQTVVPPADWERRANYLRSLAENGTLKDLPADAYRAILSLVTNS
ncbi:uncharacterized protein LOC125373259, partial [Haliotis rufescens]|uniref:uncharacterized protein LOC125373259 n=1 Tax=Haliotis rufescens TaxID=6454 RepID=UPI00201F9D43